MIEKPIPWNLKKLLQYDNSDTDKKVIIDFFDDPEDRSKALLYYDKLMSLQSRLDKAMEEDTLHEHVEYDDTGMDGWELYGKAVSRYKKARRERARIDDNIADKTEALFYLGMLQGIENVIQYINDPYQRPDVERIRQWGNEVLKEGKWPYDLVVWG